VLIFDEVITGFRVAYGGAQELYMVTPDMTCLGKIIGGGLPVGAYGGRRELMECVAPVGPVYQAGTLSGNPLAVSAGIATLEILREPGFYDELERKSAMLERGLKEEAARTGLAVQGNRVGSMMTLFFTSEPVCDYASAKRSDTEVYAAFFREMLERGVYLAPSQFEAVFLSAAHTREDIAATVERAAEALTSIRTLSLGGLGMLHLSQNLLQNP
jgi:glutamate-1-semialdehyde 2,1-aminomutase